ncbi:MAG: hypothetical protein J6A87_05470, partial [Clostridia bacterium]|nr:hypothetical protein [Clostridia bacterium]
AEGASEMSAEEVIVAASAKKEVMSITLASCAALVVLALVATTNVKWFALAAIVGVIAAAIAGLKFVPALYVPMKEAADKKPKEGYVGAKKTSTKEKKVFAKKEAPVAPVALVAPAAPVVEEPAAPAEEVEEVEEVTEEAVEETVEEPAVEETAEVVEETVEETVEEAVEAPVEEAAEDKE